MAITRAPITTIGQKVLVSSTARKLLEITTLFNGGERDFTLPGSGFINSLVKSKTKKGDSFHEEYAKDYERWFKVWDASSVGTATGDPLIQGLLGWKAGEAQLYIPASNGLVIETGLPCVVIWDT